MADEKSISNVLRLMEVVVQKVDGLASDVRTNTYTIDRVENKVDKLESDMSSLKSDVSTVKSDVSTLKSDVSVLRTDVRTLSGQFSDVGVLAIKDHKRVDDLEQRVDILEQKPH